MATTTHATYSPYDHSPQDTFDSFGEFLLAVRSADLLSRSSGRIDPRLHALNTRAALGASESVPSGGGFLIAPQFSKEIVRRAYNVGQILRRCFSFPITQPNSSACRLPQFDETSRVGGSRLGGVTSAWINEADSLTASKPRFMSSELTTEKVIALLYVTDELLADSDALDRWATYALSLELAYRVEQAIVTGTGAGQAQGIMNSPALITVPEVGGQAAGSLVSANIQSMMAAFWTPSMSSEGACWLYNQSLLPSLASLSLAVGTSGGSEARMWEWATSTEPNRLCGIPAYPSEYCAVAGTPSDILLCDFSRYVLATREQIKGDLSMDLLFTQDTSTFRCIWRVNGQTLDKSSVIPSNGTQPTSPFVALATRS